ncbi:MAG: hypothetical protein RLZ71_783 [Actinomycetota bacterium]|jgi:hypothetical protein
MKNWGIKRALGTMLVALFAVVGFSPVSPASAAGVAGKYVDGTEDYAFLFDPLVVNDVDLQVPNASWNALAGDWYQGPDPGQSNQVGWQPATATFHVLHNGVNETVGPYEVGIHFKGGWGSRRNWDSKPSFKIKMNFVVPTQRLFGLKELTLNNEVQDASMLRETTAYRLARLSGLQVPRTGYMKVVVNGINYGLHLNIETYNKQLFKHYGMVTTHSYEGAYWDDLVIGQFEAMQMHDGDTSNRNDLAAVSAINSESSTNAVWYSKITTVVDMKQLVLDWAIERYTEHWDSYSWTIHNNYFVNFDEDSMMTMHPWGMDQTFSNSGVTMLDTGGSGLMFQRCVALDACLGLYQNAVRKVHKAALDNNMTGFVDEVYNAIYPAVAADPRKPTSNWGATSVMDGTKASLVNRQSNVYSQARIYSATYNSGGDNHIEPTLSVSYNAGPSQAVGTTLAPTVSYNGGNTSYIFRKSKYSTGCDVNSVTGVVTVVGPGLCKIITLSARNATYSVQIATTDIYFGRIDGVASFSAVEPLQYGTSIPIEVTSNSTGAQHLHVAGPCTLDGAILTAESGSDACLVSVVVDGDAGHTESTAQLLVPLTKMPMYSYDYTTDPRWVGGSKLPIGQTLKLFKAPSKVTGNCTKAGAILTAKAATGSCKVTFDAWTTTNYAYPSKTFSIPMTAKAQAFSAALPAAGTIKIGVNRYQLSKTDLVKTSAGSEASFTSGLSCVLMYEAGGIFVQMTGTAKCYVTAYAPGAYKVAAVKRVWGFTR